jgi:hypothetical protein
MFGCELTRTPFDRLWLAGDRTALADLVRALAGDAEAVVAGVTARNADSETAELEMILLPLTCADGAGRILGSLAAVSAPYWLGTRPLQTLQLGEMRHIGADAVAMLAEDFALHGKAKTDISGVFIAPAARAPISQNNQLFHEIIRANPPLTRLE